MEERIKKILNPSCANMCGQLEPEDLLMCVKCKKRVDEILDLFNQPSIEALRLVHDSQGARQASEDLEQAKLEPMFSYRCAYFVGADAQLAKVSPVIARLEAEKKELTRKGEELCCFGGNLLIEKHDLEKHIAELEEKALREFEKLMDLASRYDELEAENKRLKNSLQELYNAHIKYQSSVDCEAPDEHLVMMDKAGKLLEAGEQGKGE